MRNTTKTWAFLILLSTGFVFSCHLFAGRIGLLWGFIAILFINCLIYFYGEFNVYKKLQGHLIEGQDPWRVLSMARSLAQKARIPTPNVYIVPQDSVQAFALGRNWRNGKIILTQGLVNKLSTDELKATIAYLTASVKNLDTMAFIVVSVLTDIILRFSLAVDNFLTWLISFRNQYSRQKNITIWVAAPLCSLITRLALSTNNYYKIDALAAQLLGDSKPLAQTLWKINSYAHTRPLHIPASIAHLFIVNPLHRHSWQFYFQLQPPMDRRIKKLIGYYPI